MKYTYSPHTGEIIKTDSPQEWMSTTDIEPPTYDDHTAGCFFKNGAWEVVISTPDTERLAVEARTRRDYLMSECDWTHMVDTPLTSTQKTAWATYRQSLRDISKQVDFPITVEWPISP